MSFKIEDLKKLLNQGKLEVQTGVFLVCEHKVLSPKVYLSGKDDSIIIEFEAPFMYLLVEKLGLKKMLNVVRPRVESITITNESYEVKLSTLGTWKFSKEDEK